MRQCDLVEGYSDIAHSLTDAMYVDGKSSRGRKTLSEEELWNLLDDVRLRCFDSYTEGAKELGWVK